MNMQNLNGLFGKIKYIFILAVMLLAFSMFFLLLFFFFLNWQYFCPNNQFSLKVTQHVCFEAAKTK